MESIEKIRRHSRNRSGVLALYDLDRVGDSLFILQGDRISMSGLRRFADAVLAVAIGFCQCISLSSVFIDHLARALVLPDLSRRSLRPSWGSLDGVGQRSFVDRDRAPASFWRGSKSDDTIEEYK